MATTVSAETLQLAHSGGFTSPEKDPLRGYYGVVSAALILESISLLLSIAVILTCTTGKHHLDIFIVCALSGMMIVMCMAVKKQWFWYAIAAIQIVFIASWLINPGIGLCGLAFSIVWFYVYRIGANMRTRIRLGMLYGQQPILDR